jgi:hypothetical protein
VAVGTRWAVISVRCSRLEYLVRHTGQQLHLILLAWLTPAIITAARHGGRLIALPVLRGGLRLERDAFR